MFAVLKSSSCFSLDLSLLSNSKRIKTLIKKKLLKKPFSVWLLKISVLLCLLTSLWSQRILIQFLNNNKCPVMRATKIYFLTSLIDKKQTKQKNSLVYSTCKCYVILVLLRLDPLLKHVGCIFIMTCGKLQTGQSFYSFFFFCSSNTFSTWAVNLWCSPRLTTGLLVASAHQWGRLPCLGRFGLLYLCTDLY